MYRSQLSQRSGIRRRPALSFGLLCCFLLLVLTSCRGSNAQLVKTPEPVVPTATPTPSPTPDPLSALSANVQKHFRVFRHGIVSIAQNGGNVSTYQKQYDDTLQAVLHSDTAEEATQDALSTLKAHIDMIALPAAQAEVQNLQRSLEAQTKAWRAQHLYQNIHDHKAYQLGYEYDSVTGIASDNWGKEQAKAARQLQDYQQVIKKYRMWLAHFHALTVDAADATPNDQPHTAALSLLKYHQLTEGKAIVVSLVKQTMQIFEHGKLVKAFLVTTGRPGLPTPPGLWQIQTKLKETVFRSGEPENSPNWYPDTPVRHAMQFQENGYFVHEAWWRGKLGAGTQFPHVDPLGEVGNEGSHGCINLAPADAEWLFSFAEIETPLVVY